MISKKRKILVAAGGTGGHLFPAMTTAESLLKSSSPEREIDILFAGAGLKENRFFDQSRYHYCSVSAATATIMKPGSVLKSGSAIARGVWQSKQLLKEYKPDLIIGFGSYHTFPLLLAARWMKIPYLLHEQNSIPGKVIRFFSKRALLTATFFPTADQKIAGKTANLAMPMREGFSPSRCSAAEGYDYFQLPPEKTTLLVVGGSQGAQFLNEQIAAFTANHCKGRSDLQILHFTGTAEQTTRLRDHYSAHQLSAIVKPFEPRMNLALRIADLMIARSGAGTIAEQLSFGVPALFIPYPHLSDNHQESNADFVVNTIGGGWKINQHHFDESRFSALLSSLLTAHSSTLKEKRKNIFRYQQKAPREQFAELIIRHLESFSTTV